MLALALCAATVGETPVLLTGRTAITLRDRVVRLEDVVTHRERLGAAGTIEIARLPAGLSRMTLTRHAVANVVRRLVPGLAVTGDDQRITFTPGPATPHKTIASTVAILPRPTVLRGEAATVEVRNGAVTIARQVVAMQRGYAGRRVFVRDMAGNVFAAAVPGAKR